MTKMTNQQIYNKVKKHLLKQKKQSIGPEGCMYRSGDLSCAIGCLIPDELYTEEIEGEALTDRAFLGLGILSTNDDRAFLLAQVLLDAGLDITDKTTLNLLSRLQTVHDVAFPNDWKEEFKEIAQRFELKP